MALINLHEFIENTIAEFDVNYFSQDRKLPEAFKTYVKSNAGGEKFSFLDYTTVVRTELSIYCPNQWFYIAAYYCKLYPILKQYKDLVYSSAELPASPKDYQKFFADLSGNKEKALEILTKGELEDDDKELLATFISDSQWWRGGKGIERNDFYYSPILSAAALVNQSQSYVAEICKYLVENPTAWKILLDVIQGHTAQHGGVLSCQETKLSQFVFKVIAACHEFDTLAKLLAHTVRGIQTLEGKDFSCVNIPEFNINRFFVISDDNTISQLSTSPKRLHTEAFIVGDENLYLTTQWADAESDTTNATFEKFANLINTVYAGIFSVRKAISGGVKMFQLFDMRGQSGHVNMELGKNMIYYGSPGTGKSYQARKDTLGKAHVRTIFHPDSDYASFVGCYKPVMEDGKIVYKYRAQAFVNAYINAWLTDEPYYLVIEEINRGNCAQIFGDIFQLLDRTDGNSDYDVHPDTDLSNYISETFLRTENKMSLDKKFSSVPAEILSGEVMRLPRNLHIIATMNTSDQSLFPMDSAFKRRWGWKFFSIKDGKKGYKIQITENGPLYDWWETIKALNEKIYATTKSADKQLGYWFAKVPEGQNIIDKETFVSKVVFYLWNDVFKDYGFGDNNAFTPETKFDAFYDDEGNVVESTVEAFIKRALNITDTPIS